MWTKLVSSKYSPTLLHRWCLPHVNSKCDQFLKASLANQDNSFCIGKLIAAKKEDEMNPWENPTAVVFINMYGI